MTPPTRFSRRNSSPFNKAALGVYRGPARTTPAPRMTAHRIRVLEAINRKEVHQGKGQYQHGWRWNDGGVMTTVTRTVNAFLACGWARVVSSHPEITDVGLDALRKATR